METFLGPLQLLPSWVTSKKLRLTTRYFLPGWMWGQLLLLSSHWVISWSKILYFPKTVLLLHCLSNSRFDTERQEKSSTFWFLSTLFSFQVIGPVRVRAEGRFGVDLDSNKWSKLLDDVYAVDVAIGKAAAARFVLWYSPSRREGMAEVRLLDR